MARMTRGETDVDTMRMAIGRLAGECSRVAVHRPTSRAAFKGFF
jgi:hypothetical protein